MLRRMTQSVARLAYPYGSVRTVRRGPARGMRFRVGPGIGVSFAWGRESMNWDWFQAHVRPGMTVYDVGANRGQMALFLARTVGPTGSVVSFEPAAEVFAELEANLALNRLANVRAVNAAAAEVDGRLTFNFDPALPTQGKLDDCEPTYQLNGAAPQSVRGVRLDTVARDWPGPGLVKIDVEGGAGRVLAGASRLLRECRPVLYIELHGPEEQVSVREFVQGAGYTVQTLDGRPVTDPTAGWASPLWGVPPTDRP